MDGANGLDKFLPKAIAAKRRRRKQGSIAETTSSNDEAGSGFGGAPDGAGGGERPGSLSSANSTPRGRSIISREQTAGSDSTNTANSLDKRSSNMTDEGEETSLASYDSDTDL